MSIKERRFLPVGIFVVVGIIVISALIIYLAKKPQITKSPIKIGIMQSLTGIMGLSEKGLVDAALLAVDEINEQGGVLGRKIEAVVVDTKTDWPTIAGKAEKLITEEQVAAIFGCWTSASRKMVKPIVEKYDSLLFYPVQHEGLETSPNIIYLGSTANQQAIPAVIWSLQNLGKRFFLVGSDHIYQYAVNNIIKDVVAARDGLVVGEAYIPFRTAQEKDINDIVNKILATNPEVIINTINGEENRRFFKALRKAGISAEKIPTMSLSVTETELAEFDVDEMIGDYGAQNYFQSLNTPANNKFVKNFKRKFGENKVISASMVNAYTALYFWRNAVIKAQSTATSDVLEQLRGAALSAPDGIVSISRESLYTWKPVLIGKIFPNKQFGIVFNSVDTIEPLPYPPLRSREHWEHMLAQIYAQFGGKWWKE